MFDDSFLSAGTGPVEFTLKDVEKLPKEGLHLTYLAGNAAKKE